MGNRCKSVFDSLQSDTFAALALFMLFALTACGRGGPQYFPVLGKVTLDGQPVTDAGVLFRPVGGGPAASGTTDAEGKFTLQTGSETGALAGDYQVSVTKQEMSGLGDFGAVGPGGMSVTWLVPEKYSRPETSGLTATVGRDSREFDFALSSQ